MFVSETIDWKAVQDYHDVGHTVDEPRARFKIPRPEWTRAVAAGLVVPRAPTTGKRAGEKRAAVATLRAQGMSYTAIAQQLGLTKSTVAYHARRAGIPADERFARRYDWSVVQAAIDGGASLRECQRRFGFSRDAWGKAVKRGDIVPADWVTPIGEILVAGRSRSRGHVKARLRRAGLKEDRCERCGISEWLKRPLSMQLHHKNGDPDDNRLKNLEFLCPNCHAQTDTYGGRNGHRRPRREA